MKKSTLILFFALAFGSLGYAQFSEDFEGATFPPTGWTLESTNTSNTWQYEEFGINGQSAFVPWDYDQDESLISPAFAVPLDAPVLTFKVSLSYFYSVDPNNNYDIIVSASDDDGFSWTQIWDETNLGEFANFATQNVVVDLMAYAGNSNLKLKFQYIGNDGADLNLDDVSVNTEVVIVNDDFAGALPVSCDATYTGDTSTATLDENDAPDGFGADLDAPNLWFSYTGSGFEESITLDFCGSSYDTSVLVYTGTSGNLTLVAGNDDDNTCANIPTNSKVTFTSDGTTTYYITVEGYNVGSVGEFTMAVSCASVNPPAVPNQTCALALSVPVDGNETLSDNSFGTVNPNQPTCDLFNAIQDVWFSFVAPASGLTDVLLTPDTMTSANFLVYSGDCSTLVPFGDCNGNLTAPLTESLTGLVAGNTYFVQVWSNSSEQGTFSLRLSDPNLENSTFDSSQFAYYPNPVKDVLNLEYSENITNVQVVNILGQQVITKTINVNQTQIDMSALPAGTYLVKVTADNNEKTIKVLKQ